MKALFSVLLVVAVFFAISFTGCSQDSPAAPNPTATPNPAAEHEPNGTFGTASQLVAGTQLTGSLVGAASPGDDYDYFYFTVPGGCNITVMASGPSGNPVMYLYNSSQVQLDYNDDTIGFWPWVGDSSVPAGTYYVMIRDLGEDNDIATYYLDLLITCP